ncbi:MAG: cyclase family protein [Lachnospiraceae bacterium]|nr:cyclase family protein [Lachnospiraceae bacterium]
MISYSTGDAFAPVKQGKVYSLGCVMEPGMTHYPLHPPFIYGMVRGHGELKSKRNETTTASDMFATATHCGTHIDSLGHVGCCGQLFGGISAIDNQSATEGLKALGMEEMEPVVSRGILLDIAKLKGTDCLEAAYEITEADVKEACEAEGVEIREGDTVIFRTGWTKYWDNPVVYNNLGKGTPGPGVEAAKYIASFKIRATGTDTFSYEVVPNNGTPVHVVLLKESGIQIMESLDLEELARDGVYEFLFICSGIRLKGGTGSPVNPLAII